MSQLLTELSRDELWLAMVLSMVACMVLGMGLSTPAAYIITAVIGAPVLVGDDGSRSTTCLTGRSGKAEVVLAGCPDCDRS